MTRAQLLVQSLPLALIACGVSTVPGGPEEPEVASIRLYDERGADLTAHIPLPATQPLRVEVRLFAFNGDPILGIPGGQAMTFTFTPMSLASSAAVTGETLVRDISATAPGGSTGTLSVRVRRLRDGTDMVFGPFDILVH